MVNRIVFLQVWVGEIPDYFWFHYETTKNLRNIDFIIFTDQKLTLDSKNYKIINTNLNEIEKLVSDRVGTTIKIKNNKKICDLKASLGDVFEEYIRDYEYFGVYDIDTLFGDINSFVEEYLGQYDFISMADEIYYNRLSGPFLIMKNTKEIRELYKNNGSFVKCFDNEEVECFEETIINDVANEKFKTKLIYSTNVETNNGGKISYNCKWIGNKVFVNDKEKMIYHFYYKNNTKLVKQGNVIVASSKKQLVDDFYWVIHFSKKYEIFIPYLMESIKRYSNRKCILYTINYTPDFIYKKQFESEQFIFRQISISEEPKDIFGRSIEIMNSKPLILMDAIRTFPNKKFVHIDSDIFLTVNADDISKFIPTLKNYPLVNSHIHDIVYLSNIVPNEEWSDSLLILMNELNIYSPRVKPRRKCNVILFDENSYSFFEEQMKIYYEYKNQNIPGVLAIFDEDSANALLSKYGFYDCLPLVDIEDSYETNINKYTDLNHPFHVTNISSSVVLPKNENEILFFHNFKKEEEYSKLISMYSNNVLDYEEIIIIYKNNSIFFEKTSFLTTKKIQGEVDFIIQDLQGDDIMLLPNQSIFNYRSFYISNIYLSPNFYKITIRESLSKRNIYNNIIKID